MLKKDRQQCADDEEGAGTHPLSWSEPCGGSWLPSALATWGLPPGLQPLSAACLPHSSPRDGQPQQGTVTPQPHPSAFAALSPRCASRPLLHPHFFSWHILLTFQGSDVRRKQCPTPSAIKPSWPPGRVVALFTGHCLPSLTPQTHSTNCSLSP